MSRLTKLIVAICWLTACASGSVACAADVEVKLTDGRTLSGSVLEQQTNDEQLALELRSSGITIRRTLAWKQIADVRVLTSLKKAEARETTRTESPPEEEAPERSEPLSQLLVQADPVSTFGKMDWDSLRVTLRGVDVRGEAVPLFGTLKVTLWGQRRVSPESKIARHPFVTETNFGSRFLAAPSNSFAYQHPFVTAPNPVVELASWTRTVNDKDDSVLVLPLQRPLPDQDVRIGTFGEATVELLMPGVGVFEANDPDVVLNHQSLVRRERLDRDGSRFFPNETTTDSQQTTRSRNRFTWPGGVSGPDRGGLPIQP